MKNRLFKFCLLIAVSILMAVNVTAQVEMFSKKGYQDPPEVLRNFVLAPRHENVSFSNLSPDRTWFMSLKGDGLTPVERMGRPYKNLGGVVVDLVANRSRSLTTGGSVGIELRPAGGGTVRNIPIPANSRVSGARWSSDGKKIAYLAHFPDATHIYIADVATGRSTKITPRPVLATLNTSFGWSADGKYILTVLIPEKRMPEPKQFVHENHLRVRLTKPGNTSLRTVVHLLEDSYDEAQLEYYTTGQIVRINAEKPKEIKNIGTPAMYSSIDLAPDGNYLRVTTMLKPFSNIVPTSSFGNVSELWDINGKVLSEISKRELREGSGGTGQRPTNPDDDSQDAAQAEPQKRSLRWRPDGVGMSYMMRDPAPPRRPADSTAAPADTAGRARQPQVRRMDRVYQWLPPYGENDAKVIYESETQISGLDYSADCQILFITESASGQSHVFAVFLNEPDKKYTIYKYRTADFYENPGSLMSRTEEESGERVIMLSSDKKYVYLSGTKYDKEWKENAPQPFVDRVELKTGEKDKAVRECRQLLRTCISSTRRRLQQGYYFPRSSHGYC
jgi:hypothetical protein